MSKLKLRMDDLRVESFQTVAAGADARGTVRGHEPSVHCSGTCTANPDCTLDFMCETYGDCTLAGSCEGTCGRSCYETCMVSCQGTCGETCGSCYYTICGACQSDGATICP